MTCVSNANCGVTAPCRCKPGVGCTDESALTEVSTIGTVPLRSHAQITPPQGSTLQPNLDGTCVVSQSVNGATVPALPYGRPTPGASDSMTCHEDFAPLLDSWMTNLNYFSATYGNYGSVSRVVHHGSLNRGRTSPSFHITGEAFDIKWIDWTNGQACRPCNGAADAAQTTTYRRIVGVEASLRKYFGVVIGRDYDDAHDDHFHVDVMCPVGVSKSSETNRLFLRDCIKVFSDSTMRIHKGAWNDNTDGSALTTLLTSIGMDCFDIFSNVSEYLIFLDYIMMHGFSNRAAGHYQWGGLVDL